MAFGNRIYGVLSCLLVTSVLCMLYGTVPHKNVPKQQRAHHGATPHKNVSKQQRAQHEKISIINHPLPSYNQSVITNIRLHVVSIFPLLLDESYKERSNYGNSSKAKLEQRMLDYLESLQLTLNHPLVSEVHVPYDQDAMPDYVSTRVETNSKLKFHKLQSAYNVCYVLEFVHEKFQDKLVMITNGDVYPGEGLDKLDYDLMKSMRLFYTPSRRGRNETRCTMPPDMCDKGGVYCGHDTYILIPTERLPKNASLLLSRNKWDSFGTENVMLYMYHHYLGYKVLNPCKVIFLYHNHCSKLRHIDRRQVLPRYLDSAPTNRLQ